MSKIVLVAQSDGERGQDGKKKIYEIVVEGQSVTLMWGKAEEARRQSKREWFQSPAFAQMFASEKKWEKIGRGYTVAYTA
jgi:predicted DNA-binding WGR domain protein